jgi:hypothetical protein
MTILTRPNLSYATPTGVVVYEKDKERAFQKQSDNNYRFPRAIPSLNAATCPGASLTDDDVVPVLAITADMYTKLKNRCDCITSKAHNPEDPTACGNCAKCEEDGKGWSYIDKTAGNVHPISISLFGLGTYTITIGSSTFTGALGPSASTVNLGKHDEDTPFIIEVTKNTSAAQGLAPYNPIVWGYLSSTKLSGLSVYFQLDQYITSDQNNAGYKVITQGSADSDVIAGMKKMISKGNNTSMKLDGYIPYTFIHQNQLAFYDCRNSYYNSCPNMPGVGQEENAPTT